MQPAGTLELSVRSPTGTTPSQLTLLAALPDGKLHEMALEGQVLPLPKLAPGSVWTQRLWARSREATGCRLTVALSCPALVVQATELAFKQPFEHRVRLSAEAGVHTLVGPSQALAAVNDGGSSSGSSSSAVPGPSSGMQAAADAGAAAAAGCGPVALVVGQSLLAQVLVASGHPVDLQLLGADLHLEPGSQLKVTGETLVCSYVMAQAGAVII